jgi:hypothetical protein
MDKITDVHDTPPCDILSSRIISQKRYMYKLEKFVEVH